MVAECAQLARELVCRYPELECKSPLPTFTEVLLSSSDALLPPPNPPPTLLVILMRLPVRGGGRIIALAGLEGPP